MSKAGTSPHSAETLRHSQIQNPPQKAGKVYKKTQQSHKKQLKSMFNQRLDHLGPALVLFKSFSVHRSEAWLLV